MDGKEMFAYVATGHSAASLEKDIQWFFDSNDCTTFEVVSVNYNVSEIKDKDGNHMLFSALILYTIGAK